MKGPRPQPTRLRALRGNPGRRPFTDTEPIPAPLTEVDTPAELVDPVSRAEWNRVVPGLVACGIVTTADRVVVVGYCQLWGRWQAAERAIGGALFVKAQKGTKVNPAVKVAERTFLLLLRAAVELGLTPSARSKVVAVPVSRAPVSKWVGLK